MNLAVISQSLTSRVYRSFYIHLQKQDISNQLDLVTSKYGFELGGQRIKCDPFEEQQTIVTRTPKKIRFFSLSTFFPHVQIWLPFGLKRIFTNKQYDFLICLCEPYSLSFLWAYLHYKLFGNKEAKFVCFSAQNIAKKFNAILSGIQKYCFANVFAILFVGHEQRMVAESQGWAGYSVYFPLWFDESVFLLADDASGKTKSSFCIGYAGSFTEQKGILDLICALEAVANKSPNLVVYFCGSGILNSQINQFKKSVQNQENVSVENLGAIGPELMPQFYNGLDLLVVPSKTTPHWKEQFGRVIIEAKACGAEVIGSNSGEIPFVINEPQNIFDEGDTSQLAELILGQIQIWHLRTSQERALARRVRADDAIKRFSSENLAKKFYNELLTLKNKEAQKNL